MNKGLFSSNSNEWATPQAFFDALDKEFGFNLDPCATPENAKCARYFTAETDGLAQDWGGGGECVLQSSIWPRDRQVGQEVLRRIAEAGYTGCHAHPCENGYGILPRLHLQQGA